MKAEKVRSTCRDLVTAVNESDIVLLTTAHYTCEPHSNIGGRNSFHTGRIRTFEFAFRLLQLF